MNRSSAIAIREHVIDTLKLVYGSVNWEDVVDSAVYGSSDRKTKGSGFRMPFSHKRAKHEEVFWYRVVKNVITRVKLSRVNTYPISFIKVTKDLSRYLKLYYHTQMLNFYTWQRYVAK